MLIMIASGKAMKQIPFEVYYSYAPSERDEKLRLELERHLMSFVHNGLIAGWHRGEILAGKVTASESLAHLQRAQLILLLVSPDFLSSHETYHFEMKLALERHARGEAYVIPILLRPVFYKNTPFAHLQMLPDNHLPITSWKHQDEAFENVANGLDRVLQRLSQEQTAAVAPHPLSAAQGAHFPDDWSSPSVSSSSIPRCDVLLVTAAQVETQAVLACCERETGLRFQRRFLGEGTYHDLHIIGGVRIFLVQTEQGTGGPGGAMLTVQEGIQLLSPSAVLLVGIAFGMRPDEQHMGDILVSRQLLGYELQRIGQNQAGGWVVHSRGDRPQAATRLLSLVRSSQLDWQGPEVHIGLLLSGEKLVDNYDFREQLRQLEPEAIGGEMEGAGLYAAAQRKRVDWIVIKAICDWADGEKGYQKQQRQQIAAENAAGFVMYVLKQGGLARFS
ncbi:MAG: TIR domain-containing protein [Chloroflexi bacterium]|nr:MAG: TIR domain-containing protein [Chloroflexota bacterium]